MGNSLGAWGMFNVFEDDTGRLNGNFSFIDSRDNSVIYSTHLVARYAPGEVPDPTEIPPTQPTVPATTGSSTSKPASVTTKTSAVTDPPTTPNSTDVATTVSTKAPTTEST